MNRIALYILILTTLIGAGIYFSPPFKLIETTKPIIKKEITSLNQRLMRMMIILNLLMKIQIKKFQSNFLRISLWM